MPSLNLILETSELERDRQVGHFDSLDTKSGVVLGFSGVVAAVAFNAAQPFRGFAYLASLAAAALATASFWPRRLPAVRPSRLRDYLMAADRITRLVLIDTYVGMLDEVRGQLATKSRRLKLAMILLALAGAASAIGEVVR